MTAITLPDPTRAPPSIVDQLPQDFARNRVVGSDEAARFLGFSIAHFRRLYRRRVVPSPIKISDRKYGWRVGDLADFAASRGAVTMPEAA